MGGWPGSNIIAMGCPASRGLRQIRTLEGANQFLREYYVAEFNRRFQVAPACFQRARSSISETRQV